MDLERRIEGILQRAGRRRGPRAAPTAVGFCVGLLVGYLVAHLCAPVRVPKTLGHHQPWRIRYATSDAP